VTVHRTLRLAAALLLFGCATANPDATGLPDAGAKPPDAGPEVCVDQDRDGHGPGAACRDTDCNDSDPAVHASALEVCDGRDNDCDGAVDEDLVAPDCALRQGVCAGARAICTAGGFAPCSGPAEYGPEYEPVETRCDGLDNDCDGVTDRHCPCPPGTTRACGLDAGACRPGMQACLDGVWGPCEGETTGSEETCNGRDDDCDGLTDDNLDAIRPDCPLTEGLCAGAQASCRGADGWSPCGPLEYGERWVADEGDADCDGLDNDCDGQTDEGCACPPAGEQSCGLDVGECRPGRQLCERGVWGECRGVVGPAAEACNGLDDDCDGLVDDGLPDLPCPLQAGVCAGASVPCADADGRAECTAAQYLEANPRYVDLETEAHCDGLDNDCDGLTDEACQCADGTSQVCGQNVGRCTQGRQTCAGGRFGECDGVPPGAEVCNGLDDDCDASVDEDAPTEACPLQTGVCAGARAVCANGRIEPCDAAAYGPAWQASETFCDQRDNDCDGETDEGCDCLDNTSQPCGSDEGVCSRGQQLCVGGRWGPCENEVPPSEETCDGRDENCDGSADEADGLRPPPCPLQEGLCAGSVQTCGGAAGYTGQCGAAEYGPRWRAVEGEGAAGEADCDGLDNDCDGLTDETCQCQPGGDRPLCGTNTGECRTGLLRCENGFFGACEGEVPPAPETCNGLDDDCNAAIDDGLAPSPCALQAGVCAGRTRRCGGEAGFLDCTPDDYGPLYRVDETGAAGACDGRDNDCDGRVDEGCPLPPVVISEVLYDGPGRDGPNEFIELSGPVGTPLTGLALEAVDGVDGRVYARFPLDGAVMPAIGAFLLVDEAASPQLRDIADRVLPGVDLQNGPDGLRLVRNGDEPVDAVGYGDFAPDRVFVGEGAPAPDVTEHSLTRDAAATDTNDNATDFRSSRTVDPGVPTPRGAPLPRLHVALRWDLPDTDLDLHFQRAGAAFRDPVGDCSFANRRPDWSDDPETPAGPRLERDDTDGLGPEFTDYGAPRPGRYRVQVHYFSDRGHGATTAEVLLFADGQLAARVVRALGPADPGGPYWLAADVEVAPDGVLTVTPRDETGAVAFPGP
jgi:hypothetical protein